MDMKPEVIEAFVEANIKEAKSWESWGSIKALTEEETREVMRSPTLRRRVIPARNAYRDKHRGVPPLKAKCRTVILGCCDPDLAQLDRTAPTPTRLSEAIVIQMATSGMNKRVQLQPKAWRLWSGDVATAFLQGTPEARELPIFMRGPRDPIQHLAGTFLARLYQVVGNLYGFSSAPRTWTKHVSDTILNKVKLKKHHLDSMFFYGNDEKGFLQIALIVHVDDFLVAFREDYPLEQLTQHFTWGSQTELTENSPITFRGKQLHLVKRSDVWEILVNQVEFIREMSTGKLPRGRLQGPDALDSKEWQEFRSCAGSLQWLGGQTRPDVCAAVSLSNHGQSTGPKELDQLYQTIHSVKENERLGLWYYPVGFDRALFIVGYGDSSWANAHQHKSQMGVIIMLCDAACLEKDTRGTVIDWKSTRSPRVTRSTLASEANSMDECVDRATFVNHFLIELLYGKGPRSERKLRQLQVTDCRSLYDAVLSPQPALNEKRTTIVVRSIQDFIQARDLRWTPTEVMWADGLTKYSKELADIFQAWLNQPMVTLVAKEKIHQCEFQSTEAIEP